jgi:hypothetical protein
MIANPTNTTEAPMQEGLIMDARHCIATRARMGLQGFRVAMKRWEEGCSRQVLPPTQGQPRCAGHSTQLHQLPVFIDQRACAPPAQEVPGLE